MQHIKEAVFTDTTNHIGPLIKITAKYIEREVGRTATMSDLTAQQMHILHYICLQREKGVVQKDIEDCFELTHATVSGIISRLENKGYLQSIPFSEDKRFKRIVPTEKALLCDNQVHRHIVNCEEKFLNGFSVQEAEQLRNYLCRILKNLDIEPMPIQKEENK